MFCSNCGNEIFEDEKFCSQCGKLLIQDEPVVEKKAANHNTSLLIGICCGVLAVIVVVFASGIAYGRGESAMAKTTVATTTEPSSVAETSTTQKPTETTKKVETTTKAKNEKPTDSKGIVEPDEYMLGEVFYVQPREGLYLRKGPGTSYSYIALLDQGVAMTEIGRRSDSPGWCYVRLMNGSTYGWVCADYISLSNHYTGGLNEYYKYSNSFTTVVLEREGVNLRTGASTNTTRLGTIPYMRNVTVLGYSAYDANWLYVSVYLDGRTQYGYVDGRYLQH